MCMHVLMKLSKNQIPLNVFPFTFIMHVQEEYVLLHFHD